MRNLTLLAIRYLIGQYIAYLAVMSAGELLDTMHTVEHQKSSPVDIDGLVIAVKADNADWLELDIKPNVLHNIDVDQFNGSVGFLQLHGIVSFSIVQGVDTIVDCDPNTQIPVTFIKGGE